MLWFLIADGSQLLKKKPQICWPNLFRANFGFQKVKNPVLIYTGKSYQDAGRL